MVHWRRSYICLLLCFLSFWLLGQHGAGVKIGVDFNKNIALFHSINIGDSLVLNSFSPKEEGNVGVWLNLGTNNIYFQTEFLIFRTEERYQINFLNKNRELMVSENRLFLEVPFLIGFNFKPLSFYGGVSPRISLNTPKVLSEWFDLERNNASTYLKYNLGIGLDLGSVNLDFRYNSQLLNYVDTMIVNGILTQPLNHIERFTLSVSIDLLRG